MEWIKQRRNRRGTQKWNKQTTRWLFGREHTTRKSTRLKKKPRRYGRDEEAERQAKASPRKRRHTGSEAAKKRTEKWLIWIKEKEWKTAANDNKGERGELN